jgi:hypothetical protein
MDLPSKERTFDFEHVGAETTKEYKGRFTVICLLNVGQRHAMSLERTRLLGNYASPIDDLSSYARLLANLRHKIVDGPDWFKQSQGGSLIEDEDCLVALFFKIQEAEAQWREDLKKKTETTPDPVST